MFNAERRRWRTIAFTTDVPAGKAVRVLCGKSEFVLFRDVGGQCRALADRCAHRRAALSGGRLTPQCYVECPYHGWRYDGATGACVAIPNLRPDEKIPKNYRVQAYETHEGNGFIQILLGAGDAPAEPNRVEVPVLDRHWQAERYLAYPEELFLPTLLDCPSAILMIGGLRILDDHPFGDPVIEDEQVRMEYAVVKARHVKRPPSRVAGDFPYTLQICASHGAARVTLLANATAQVFATTLLVAVPAGPRVTRVLWRGAARTLPGTQPTIDCRGHVEAASVRAATI